jgi:spoIIIJ-associated protein
MTFSDSEKIKKEIEEFFSRMTFEAEIKNLSREEQTLSVDLRVEEPQILIGERGETLFEIQHLLKIIIKRKFSPEEPLFLDLDVNDYKKKKIAYLKEMARSSAEEVLFSRKEKILPPMSAYERRIIHMELAENPNITTESTGEEPERKVVIRPYP